MPPRIDVALALRRCRPAPSPCVTRTLSPFVPVVNASTVAQRKRAQDPYARAQARARKQANISKQETLEAERTSALGDPVSGITTPFLARIGPAAQSSDPEHARLNYLLPQAELQTALENSKELVKPFRNTFHDIAKFDAQAMRFEQQHDTASEALARIANIENGSSKDRTRNHIQECIETFGRHNTDQVLKPKPSASEGIATKTPRAGPDTGSSEVQIAILTAKIRVLSHDLEARGQKDKVNKRNLRLLVHRRQKLLRYLKRQDRGGERWQNTIATLGLTPGTYEGEISL